MDEKEISVFELLLHTFAKMLSDPEIAKVKRELVGYLSKDQLQNVDNGKELMELLTDNGLLSDKKLMFFKKILNKACLHKQENILMEYVARKKDINGNMVDDSRKIIDKKTQLRMEALEKAIQRQIVAIKYKKEQLQCEIEEGARQEMAIDIINCSIKSEEDRLEAILTRKKVKETELKKYKHRYEEVLRLISQNEAQRSKLIEETAAKDAEIKELESTKKGRSSRKNSIFDMVLHQPNIEKLQQNISKLRKEILNIAKEREMMEYKLEHIETRQDRHKDALRIINLDRVAKLKEILLLEKKLISVTERHSEQARKVRNIQLEVVELENAMEGNEIEKKQTADNGLLYHSDFLTKAYTKIKEKIESEIFQVLKYKDLDELDSYVFGQPGTRLSPLQFRSPACVVFGKRNELFILDKGNKRIVITDLLGHVHREPIILGDVFKAVDMTINSKGQLLLLSTALIKILTDYGELIFQFLPEYEANEQLPELTGIAVNVDDEIFLCDAANKNIQCFTEHGEFIRFIRLEDFFYNPSKLAIVGKSELVVSDSMENNLKVIDVSKDIYTKPNIFGQGGVLPGEFICPRGLAIDRDNNILIVDSGNHRIQAFNARKEVIATFGRLGSRPGCLDIPIGVAVHPFGIVAVADSRNNRVVLFS